MLAKGLTEALETEGGKMAYRKGIVVLNQRGYNLWKTNSRNSHWALGTYSKVIMGITLPYREDTATLAKGLIEALET